MKFINLVVFILLIAMFTGCTSSEDFSKGTKLLAEGKGIKSYYYFLKSNYSDKTGTAINKVINRSRDLAIVELNAIYLKPGQMGSKDIYLDNEDMEKINYIFSKDNEIKVKFLK